MEICVVGTGSFAIAVASQLSNNEDNSVTLYSRDKKQTDEINNFNKNSKYYPNKILNKSIKATCNKDIVSIANIVFLAVPSNVIKFVVNDLKETFNDKTLIINLAKGIFENGETIVEFLRSEINNNNIVTMKGGTFSEDMMNNSPSLFTLGFNSIEEYQLIKKVIDKTNIYVDYTSDIRGVELLSVLKTIYAILIGITDAKYNSANTRFMLLTKVFSEIRILLLALGGVENTLYLSAGYGDIGLTSLNDMSRNRTLGLLIGKGFFTPEYLSNTVVLEGVKAIKMIFNLRPESIKDRTHLLNKLNDFFEKKEKQISIDFEALISKQMKVVLTYGTFDLLHYGHLEILRRCKSLGDKLIVGLSTDEFNLEKGKKCVMPYNKRKEFLESLDYVDLVIPEKSWGQKERDVLNNNVNLFVMGNDWEYKFDFLKKYCDVSYLERTKGISTTKLKAIIKED